MAIKSVYIHYYEKPSDKVMATLTAAAVFFFALCIAVQAKELGSEPFTHTELGEDVLKITDKINEVVRAEEDVLSSEHADDYKRAGSREATAPSVSPMPTPEEKTIKGPVSSTPSLLDAPSSMLSSPIPTVIGDSPVIRIGAAEQSFAGTFSDDFDKPTDLVIDVNEVPGVQEGSTAVIEEVLLQGSVTDVPTLSRVSTSSDIWVPGIVRQEQDECGLLISFGGGSSMLQPPSDCAFAPVTITRLTGFVTLLNGRLSIVLQASALCFDNICPPQIMVKAGIYSPASDSTPTPIPSSDAMA